MQAERRTEDEPIAGAGRLVEAGLLVEAGSLVEAGLLAQAEPLEDAPAHPADTGP